MIGSFTIISTGLRRLKRYLQNNPNIIKVVACGENVHPRDFKTVGELFSQKNFMAICGTVGLGIQA